MIEKNGITREVIRQDVEPGVASGADVVVLACTHYHWIEAEVKSIVGDRAAVLQPEAAVIKRLKTIKVARQRP